MLKCLVILAVATFMAISVSGQPDKTPSNKQTPAPQSQPAVISPNGKDKQSDSQTNQSHPSNNPPAGNASVERPHWWSDSNWLIVIITGLTGGFICWQA